MRVKTSRATATIAILSMSGLPLIAGVSELAGFTSTPLSLVMRSFVVALGCLVIYHRIAYPKRIFLGPYWSPLAVFWILYLSRLVVDTALTPELLARPAYEYWLWAVGVSLVPSLAVLTAPSEEVFHKTFTGTFVLLLMAGLIAFALGAGLAKPHLATQFEIGRLNLTSLNPISVGHLGLSILIMCMWALVKWKEERSVRFLKLWALCGLIVGTYLLIASASRGPLVALVGVVLFYGASQKIKGKLASLGLFLIATLIIYHVASYLEHEGQFRVLSRVLNSFDGNDMAVSARSQAYAGALDQFLNSPLLGDFIEERTTGFYPHNILLESFMATG